MTQVVIREAIVDLRSEPKLGQEPSLGDALQCTQLLYGETVEILEEHGDWARVTAPEQPCYGPNGWQGYPGWVPRQALGSLFEPAASYSVVTDYMTAIYEDKACTKASVHLPLGARVLAEQVGEAWHVELVSGKQGWMQTSAFQTAEINSAIRRAEILRLAQSFIGSPYFWGGHSPYQPEVFGARSGVDCSGLVSISYRALGIVIPRDAKDQARRAHELQLSELQPGDLVFTAPLDEPEAIDHVLLYVSPTKLLESTRHSNSCRLVSWEAKFGVTHAALYSGLPTPNVSLTFGSFISDE